MKRFGYISVSLLFVQLSGLSIYIRLIFLFPVKPIHFEPEPQTLKSIDMLEPEEMLEDFAYLVEVIESVHPDHIIVSERGMDQRKMLCWRDLSSQ